LIPAICFHFYRLILIIIFLTFCKKNWIYFLILAVDFIGQQKYANVILLGLLRLIKSYVSIFEYLTYAFGQFMSINIFSIRLMKEKVG